ncbi:hypothetical protein [Sphingomonas sp. BAUL-RG-20F-R05-02]|uniref:hypothetical protein n=1 Tax=Sphingomonas sp. BAUL-RG-20F-R05-02 TaxID=2914830 RepID=UPI001F56B90A|nr:hypothetical protein [Sphingomonas sp. BAUL-RG-20F-R05-02]
MDIRAFRTELGKAFYADGFQELRLRKGASKVWALPSSEVIAYFAPDAQRRAWGFNLFGTIGIEIPKLRSWLNEHKSGQDCGIFHSGFIGYYTLNEEVLRDFRIEHGLPIPFDLWVGLIKDRLNRIPQTLDGLIATYRTNREALGWLAHPGDKAAWDFLVQWMHDPDPSLSVPYRLPTGQIAHDR